jgi:hypothetical protein
MDQSRFGFPIKDPKTLALAKQAAKTMHIRKTSSEQGEWLKPMIIFKGTLRGIVAQKELKTFNPSTFYACQKLVWMDETCMIWCVQLVLKEYLRTNPPLPGVVLVLILDAYQCHLMSSVVDGFRRLGIKVIYIPGRCTGLCQRLDVICIAELR